MQVFVFISFPTVCSKDVSKTQQMGGGGVVKGCRSDIGGLWWQIGRDTLLWLGLIILHPRLQPLMSTSNIWLWFANLCQVHSYIEFI